MAWQLEIHHIEVGQGDATLVIAREVAPLIGAAPIVRSVLIDGGHRNYANTVHTYITTPPAALAALDVLVVTHYDEDHYGGIKSLLLRLTGAAGGPIVQSPVYQNTLIYDQGWPQARIPTGYIRAINGRSVPAAFAGNNRHRVTASVHSDNIIPPLANVDNVGPPAAPMFGFGANGPALAAQQINWPANWLVGKEIMWADQNGNPDPTLYGGAAPAVALPVPAPAGAIAWPAGAGVPDPGTPGGPPAVTCIAANLYLLQAGGGVIGPVGGFGADPKNEKSLTFLITFNNFRYYVGGDISSVQEDGIPPGSGIKDYLNPVPPAAPPPPPPAPAPPPPVPPLAGRVHAMKTSHHGAHQSTSRAFINHLLPVVAIISCGNGNSYGHPHQEVINILEGYDANSYTMNPVPPTPAAPQLAVPNPLLVPVPPAPPPPAAPPSHSVDSYYLTTEGAAGADQQGARGPHRAHSFLGTGAEIIAGNPPAAGGHIRLTVTEAGSGFVAGPPPGLAAGGVANFDVTYDHPPDPAGNAQTTHHH